MLTKNFYHAMMAIFSRIPLDGGYVKPDGTVSNVHPGYSSSILSSMYDLIIADIPTSTPVGVRIGSGVTPATADDYTLESVIASNMSVTKPSKVSVTRENDFVAVYATYSVTNIGSTPIDISEIGLFSDGYYANSSSSHTPILMDRTVLESPITVNPGESKPLTYTIRFNYPTV